ncbi:MAG: hypothetical protein IIA65_06345 [Planctomycetes bacterium]|nr:hypothetical protein [Planctomycetota bacterium]
MAGEASLETAGVNRASAVAKTLVLAGRDALPILPILLILPFFSLAATRPLFAVPIPGAGPGWRDLSGVFFPLVALIGIAPSTLAPPGSFSSLMWVTLPSVLLRVGLSRLCALIQREGSSLRSGPVSEGRER